jgi:hypothetical protein
MSMAVDYVSIVVDTDVRLRNGLLMGYLTDHFCLVP